VRLPIKPFCTAETVNEGLDEDASRASREGE
jgi:hypothetical protein